MRRISLVMITTLSAALFLAAGVFGGEGKMMHKSTTMSSAEHSAVEGGLHSASKFIGTEVRDASGNDIGEVKDVAFDFNRGIGYAVIESDELGKADQRFLVPLSALTSTHEGEFVTLTVDRSKLAAAPMQEPGMTDEAYGRQLYDFYGLSYPWSDLPGDVPIRQQDVPGSNLTYPGNRPVIPESK
jgi:sporulation protein YlmC with PRC-barrel domain